MLTTPPVVVEPFAINGNKNAIPVPSQIGIVPGAASFNDGFPPQTMIPLTSGGVPPSGLDFNGIFYMLSAHTAWLQGGGQYSWDADFVANNTGYAAGAILQSAVTPTRFYLCTVDDTANDPDSSLTGWLPFSIASTPTELQTATLAAGTTATLAVNASTGFLDLTANAAGSTLTALGAGFDGQIIVVTNVAGGGALLTLSASGNIRLPADLSFLQYSGVSLRYSSTLTKWVPLS
jgi:hypothetical protein